jgi:methionyl-tRNA formyltransferase
LRVVFLGSGAFAIPAFEALIGAGHDVAALVTQPDREKGRGRALTPPPLKPVAEARGVPVHQPRRIREPAAQETLRALAPDVQVVVAYGQILPRTVIDIPRLGTVNVPGSLLKRISQGNRSPEEWMETLNSMLNEGAPLSDADYPVVLAYLSKNFAH